MPPHNETIEQLHQLATVISQQLEIAEAVIPEINLSLARLVQLEMLPADLVVEGAVILEQLYPSESARPDSGQVIQAVLVTSRGIGAVYWDLEEYQIHRRSPGMLSDIQDTLVKFAPFDQCSRAVQALLLAQTRPLLDTLRSCIQLPRT